MSVGLSDHYWKLALVNLEMLDRYVAQDRFKRFLIELVRWFKSMTAQHAQLIRERTFVMQCLELVSNVVNLRIIESDDEPQFAGIRNIFSFLATITEDEAFFKSVFRMFIETASGIDEHYSSSGWSKVAMRFFGENNIRSNLDVIIAYLNAKGTDRRAAFWYEFICMSVFTKYTVSMKKTSHLMRFLVGTKLQLDPLRSETCEVTFRILSCNERERIREVNLFMDKYLPSRVERVRHNSDDMSQSILCDYELKFADPENVQALCAWFDSQNLLPQFLRICLAVAVSALARNAMDELIQALLKLRELWKVASANGISNETAKLINQDFYSVTDQKSYPMVSLVELTLLYDIQCVDVDVWKDFLAQIQLGNETVVSSFETFAGVLGVAFAPLFLGVQNLSLKQHQRKRVKFLEDMQASPGAFADSQGLIPKQNAGAKKFVFDLRADKYTKETALSFIGNVLRIFPFSSMPQIYSAFLSSFLATQRIFPVSFDLDFGFVAHTFFDDFGKVEFLADEKLCPRLILMMKSLALVSYPWFTDAQKLFWQTLTIWAMRNDDTKATVVFLSQMGKFFNSDFGVFIPILLEFESQDNVWHFSTASELYAVVNMILSLYTIASHTEQTVPLPNLEESLALLGIRMDKQPLSQYRVRLITLFFKVLNLNKEQRTLNHQALFEILALCTEDKDMLKFNRRTMLIECAQSLTPDEKRSLELTYCDVDQVSRLKPNYPGDLMRSLNKTDIDVALNILFYYPSLYHDFQTLFKLQSTSRCDCLDEFFGNQTENRQELEGPVPGNTCYIVNEQSICIVSDCDEGLFSAKTRAPQNASTYEICMKECTSSENHSLVFPEDETESDSEEVPATQDGSQFFTQSNLFDETIHHWDSTEFSFPRQTQQKFQFDPPSSPSIEHVDEKTAPSPCSGAFFTILGNQTNVRKLEVDQMRARGLGQLVTSHPRRTAKIGVVYVRKGQTDQGMILRNTLEDTTPLFRSFLTSIGDIVDLEKFTGYDGKLDVRRFSNGRHSVYFSDKRNEVMFHVVPLMPTVPGDDQQIIKKRHVGNDHVHIVWCENDRGYDTETISSQFNNAHIIIHPLESDMFMVTMSGKSPHYKFGPLPEGSVIIDAKPLGFLVRYLALFADITVRSDPEYEGTHTKYELFKTSLKELH